MRDKPFHREIGIDAAGFRQGRLGLVHPAVECVGGREVGVRYAVSKTGFDRVVNSIDPGAVMTLALSLPSSDRFTSDGRSVVKSTCR